MQRDIAEAESTEREAAAAAAKAQHALDRDIWTAASGAAATPSPLAREQGINSRSKRPGDDAFWTGNVACVASSSRVKFSSELATSVVAKASTLLASVRKASLHGTDLLSVERAG